MGRCGGNPEARGTEQLFTFPSSPLIDACAELGIPPYICRQERVGVGMADGYSRATSGRKVSVFAMQSGPGSENAFAGVATTFADSTPVLIIPLGLQKERATLYPNFDSAKAFSSVTKSFERITAPELVVPVMRRSFAQLRSGRPGPVMVEVPIDVGRIEVDSIDGYMSPTAMRSAADPAAVDNASSAFSRPSGRSSSPAKASCMRRRGTSFSNWPSWSRRQLRQRPVARAPFPKTIRSASAPLA